jgi:hypothetical protein
MKLERRKPSGREKDQTSIKLLEKLREQLYSSNVSTIRQSAFNLSWMQEDGLDILKEALFGDALRRTKSAAAYGLRKMRGRMRKVALDVLSAGLEHSNKTTVEACQNALLVLKKTKPTANAKDSSKKKPQKAKFRIREIARGKHKRERPGVRNQRNRYSKR